MGRYIAHTRRKIKPKKVEAASNVTAAVDAREQALTIHLQRKQLEIERAREDKQARALARRLERRSSVLDMDTSGRRHTAARAAGIVLISATVGLRTLGISIQRIPGSAASDLWSVDLKCDVGEDVMYSHNPSTPPGIDAVHLMRALAPRLAEELIAGAASKGADQNNLEAAFQLADSLVSKSRNAPPLAEDEKRDFNLAIVKEFEDIVAFRLSRLRSELSLIVEALMWKTTVSRSGCDAILAPIYARFESFGGNEPSGSCFCLPAASSQVDPEEL